MNIFILTKQAFSLIIYLIIAFVLIHFLAVFGVFLAVAIPLLHLVFYPKIACFSCRLTHSHHSLRHSLQDGGIILILTLLTLPIIYGETKLISYLFSQRTTPQIATIAEFSIPSRSQYQVGTIFPFPLQLTRIPTSINVAQADLSFDPSLLEVIDISTDGTFAQFFVQKEYDNSQGYVRVTGGIPNPGYSKSEGLIATIYFRAKLAGAVQLKYLESSLVLANDGRGTNLLADYPVINLVVTPSDHTTTDITDIQFLDQVQGDTDKTVLSFTDYAHSLPVPFENVQGQATHSYEAISLPSQDSTATWATILLRLNQQILRSYRSFLP